MHSLSLLYVDDIIVTSNDTSSISSLIKPLSTQFAIKDLGTQHFFSWDLKRRSEGIVLSEQKYALELLEHAQMLECKPIATPLSMNKKFSDIRTPLPNPTKYRAIVVGLLTFTRSDLFYSVNTICQYMHAPTYNHLKAVHCILRYLKGTVSFGYNIYASSSLKLNTFKTQLGRLP